MTACAVGAALYRNLLALQLNPVYGNWTWGVMQAYEKWPFQGEPSKCSILKICVSFVYMTLGGGGRSGQSTLGMFQQEASHRQLCQSAANTFWHVHVVHRRSQGGLGAIPPKFLKRTVIFCFERRYSKQNSVICLQSNIVATTNFFGPSQIFGLATLLVWCQATWFGRSVKTFLTRSRGTRVTRLNVR